MLDVIYYPVSAILWFWHVIFGGLLDPASGVYNIPDIQRSIPNVPVVLVHLAQREQGIKLDNATWEVHWWSVGWKQRRLDQLAQYMHDSDVDLLDPGCIR